MRMRNKIVFLLFIGVFIMGLLREPVQDTIDVLSGATNQTYSTTSDAIAGASEEEEDDD